MAYFRAYTISFQDSHGIHPANWRIDILDDQGSSNSTPLPLVPAAEEPPLIIERLDTSDDKATRIIGSQASISYEYTGATGEPTPELFGDSDERRFRVEVYKNNTIYGVWYVKPDFIEYDDKFPPYTVTLTAVDGLSFIKGADWDAYDNGGLLSYVRMTLYEIIMSRGLLQVLDTDTAVNVINTLRPENISGDETLLNDLFIHSDQFIDFTKGPDKIFDVLDKALISLYSRLFIAQNQVWIQRLPDLMQASIEAENYINGIFNSLPLPTIFRTIGPNISSNDGTPVDDFGRNISFPAIKQASYTLDYKSINQLQNFQWSQFNGTDYTSWTRFNPVMILGRKGDGSLDDPYNLFIPYPQPSSPSISYLFQLTASGSVSAGDIVNISFNYQFGNVKRFKISIRAGTIGGTSSDYYTLDSSGTWIYDFGSEPIYIEIQRSGNKKNGSFNLTSSTIPSTTPAGDFPVGQVQVQIFPAFDPDPLDPGDDPGIRISPIKVGISPLSSKGRGIKDINNARYSQVKDPADFYFIDTGIDTISTSVFVDEAGTTAQNWNTISAPADIQDIERHMADANLDQYARSVAGWSGSLYSNTIEFWHIFTMVSKPGKRFIMMNDRYDVRTCTHECNFQEILPENGASTTYSEYDIEDSN